MVKIEFLGDYREHIETVTNFIWNEFGNEDNYKFFESIVSNSLNKDKLPITFVALKDDEVVGTIGLWRADLISRQDLFPWLSALYVKEEYRGTGIGKKLQNFLVEYARNQGFKELFLYTDINGYYEKMDWQYIKDGIEYSGDYIKIYRKEL